MTGDELIQAIDRTLPAVIRFSKIAEIAAVMADTSAVMTIRDWFGQTLERYDLPRGFSGTFSHADFDYFRFVGHELFVTLIAFLLREQQGDIVSRVLSEPIPVRYVHRQNAPGNSEWFDLCQYVRILGDESQERSRISYHGDLLNEHHSKGELAGILPFEEFVDGDFFLFLRDILPQGGIPEAVFMEAMERRLATRNS